MSPNPSLSALVVSLLVALLVVLVSTGIASAADLRIEHVTIVSPERDAPLRNAVVRIHDGRIAAISTFDPATVPSSNGEAVIDGSGLFLSPGLIDGHVHLSDIPGMTPEQEARHPDIAKAARAQIPRSFLLYGFTTLVDLISAPVVMARWKDRDVVPDTCFCGGAALMDGYAMNYAPKPQRYRLWPYMLIEPGTQAPDGIDPAQHTPQAVVARMKADGAICVKTFFERGFGGARNLPVPKLETIRELVKAAHAEGLPVLIHANTEEAHRFALDAGVDVIVHGLWNFDQRDAKPGELPSQIREILDAEITRGIGYQPTMQVLQGITGLFSTTFLSDPRLSRVMPSGLIDWYGSTEGQWFRREMMEGDSSLSRLDAAQLEKVATGQMQRVLDRSRTTAAYVIAHDGRLLFGTDTPSAPTYANPPGLNGWLEMSRRVDAGETPARIFRSATIANARAFKLDRDIGTVEAGKKANLLLMRQDPTQTIDAYAGIVKVILGGRVLESSDLAARAAR